MLQKLQRLYYFFILILISVTFTGCSEEVYDIKGHTGTANDKNKVSFDQFRKETKIKDFAVVKEIDLSSAIARTARVQDAFVVDTTSIFRYVSQTNKISYSFKIYPLNQELKDKEYYNLVYSKTGDTWYELVFINKEREHHEPGKPDLESSNLIYRNPLGGIHTSTVPPSLSDGEFCETVTITVSCDGSCSGSCDGFACPTGQCLVTTVSYEYCGSGGGGGGGGFDPGDGSGGPPDGSGIYIPNPYNGDEDPNNPDFILATQTGAFIRSLPPALRDIVINNADNVYLQAVIINYFRTNGGLTEANRNNVIGALQNFIPVYNLQLAENTGTEIFIFHYNVFQYLLNNPGKDFNTALALTPRNTQNNSFVKAFIDQVILNPDLNFDVEASLKSPFNIDRSAIDNNTVEGARFNEAYNALKEVPEFKALFTAIFDGPQTRLNVKFEIHEHVYHEDNPLSYEVAANTESSRNSNNNTYTIKVNKQTLVPSGSFYQNKLENAQTIAHEGIHAFLSNLFKNPNTIATIPNIDQKDLKEILDALQSANPSQHNIMFNNLTQTLQQILQSLKNVLTTPAQRALVEDLMINESQNPPHNPQIWNWDTYFRYLSYIGLDGTSGFQAQFPDNSDALHNFNLYITYGRAYLNL